MSTSCRWEQVILQHLFICHVCQADGVQRTWSTWPTPGSRPASGAGGELEGRQREAGRRVAGRRYLGPCGHPRGKDLHPSVLQVQSLKNRPQATTFKLHHVQLYRLAEGGGEWNTVKSGLTDGICLVDHLAPGQVGSNTKLGERITHLWFDSHCSSFQYHSSIFSSLGLQLPGVLERGDRASVSQLLTLPPSDSSPPRPAHNQPRPPPSHPPLRLEHHLRHPTPRPCLAT